MVSMDRRAAATWCNLDDAMLMTLYENLNAWWEIYRASGGNKGLLTRDYSRLDEILSSRLKAVGEWMRKVGYTGEVRPLLKDQADQGCWGVDEKSRLHRRDETSVERSRRSRVVKTVGSYSEYYLDASVPVTLR